MAEPKYAFYRAYVDKKFFNEKLAKEMGYIPIPSHLIEAAKDIIYEEGKAVVGGSPTDKILKAFLDFLLKGNLIKTNPSVTKPDIEIHSETEKGLEEVLKKLGLPEK